jgi:phosphoribosylaminoimidazole-succinocarboxamide synthase
MSILQLPGWELVRRGKVREVYASGDRVLLVASDRLSAFDCVLPDPIPGKGEVLTQLSAFWFQRLDFVPNHFVSADFATFPAELQPFAEQLAGRSMLCRKSKPLPVECVVRGYLAGAAWDEYRDRGTVGGHEVPRGLREASKLPAPLFTPTTKATEGHDEPISWEKCRRLLGDELAHAVREASFEVYDYGRIQAERAGVIIADTKFEFGLIDGFGELRATLQAVRHDPNVRALVLRGAAGHFCAGGDIKDMAGARAKGGDAYRELNRAFGALLEEAQAAPQGVVLTPSTPDEFGTFLRSEVALWAKVVKDTGIKAE